jgi:hypothetical protein
MAPGRMKAWMGRKTLSLPTYEARRRSGATDFVLGRAKAEIEPGTIGKRGSGHRCASLHPIAARFDSKMYALLLIWMRSGGSFLFPKPIFHLATEFMVGSVLEGGGPEGNMYDAHIALLCEVKSTPPRIHWTTIGNVRPALNRGFDLLDGWC